jgi:hypothetical protein
MEDWKIQEWISDGDHRVILILPSLVLAILRRSDIGNTRFSSRLGVTGFICLLLNANQNDYETENSLLHRMSALCSSCCPRWEQTVVVCSGHKGEGQRRESRLSAEQHRRNEESKYFENLCFYWPPRVFRRIARNQRQIPIWFNLKFAKLGEIHR